MDFTNGTNDDDDDDVIHSLISFLYHIITNY